MCRIARLFRLENLRSIFNVFREAFDERERERGGGGDPLASALISAIVTTISRNTVECYEHYH
jgi:hypothetical protein